MQQHLPFHQQLKLERERRGWSQADLADKVGSSEKTVTRWETGQSLPQPHYRQQFSKLFGKTPEELGLLDTPKTSEKTNQPAELPHRESWGDAPRGNIFYGRENEQTALQSLITQQRCRVIAVLGIGGVGKTSITAKSAIAIKDAFSSVFWFSLRNASSLDYFLQQCLQIIIPKPQPLPVRSDELLSLLLQNLQEYRCLIILDNFESLLQPGQRVGHYREGYEQYGRLLQQLGETEHQSCLLLTSREKPREIAYLEGRNSPVRSLSLTGVGESAGQELLQEKDIHGTPAEWAKLIQQYAGNPLALRLVATPIQEMFAGSIAKFLQTDEIAFGDITDLLDQQFQRLTSHERELLYWLAIEREAVTLEELQANLIHPVAKKELVTTLDSLRRRFLFEQRNHTYFMLQPVIQEYVTNEIVQHACAEFGTELSETWSNYAFLKARSREYIRESQQRLILGPITQRLQARYGQNGLEQKMRDLLARLRALSLRSNNYSVGNILNLLMFCRTDLSTFDFSHLPINQAYFQGIGLTNVNFYQAYFRECMFTNTFGDILSVTFSPDGQRLAAGTSNGEIWLYSLQYETPLRALRGHTDGVWSVAFSPDGKLIASGSDDQTVRLWNQESGNCLQILSGHTNRVRAVTFNPDGSMLASGGEDQMIHLWSMPAGSLLQTLTGHSGRVWSIDFSPDGHYLASGSTDKTVRIWETDTGNCTTTLAQHTNWVRSVRFSANGHYLASASDDQTVRLWDCQQETYQYIFSDHHSGVWSIAFTPDNKTLISGSEDTNLRLWDLQSGTCRKVLQGHSRGIRALSVASTGQWMASGGEDQAIYLWDLATEVYAKIFRGYTNRIWSIDSSQHNNQLASCSEDGSIRLWDLNTASCIQTFYNRTHSARCVAIQPGGTLLASSGEDQTVHLWDLTNNQRKYVLPCHTTWARTIAFSPDGLSLATGGEDGIIYIWHMNNPAQAHQRRLTLDEHTSWIRSVAFQPHGDLLASGSDDQTIRLWNRHTGQCVKVLTGHEGRVRAVAFHPNGKILASGSEDRTIRFWDLFTGDCIATLPGHLQRILTLAFNHDGQLLASGGNDATVRIWSTQAQTESKQLYTLRTTIQGHQGQIRSVCFHTNPPLLASASEDGTIKLWDINSSATTDADPYLATLISGRPYEGMNITQAQGLTEAQTLSLLALGAIDDNVNS